MSDYLTNLAARATGAAATIRPRLASLYEPAPAAEATPEFETAPAEAAAASLVVPEAHRVEVVERRTAIAPGNESGGRSPALQPVERERIIERAASPPVEHRTTNNTLVERVVESNTVHAAPREEQPPAQVIERPAVIPQTTVPQTIVQHQQTTTREQQVIREQHTVREHELTREVIPTPRPLPPTPQTVIATPRIASEPRPLGPAPQPPVVIAPQPAPEPRSVITPAPPTPASPRVTIVPQIIAAPKPAERTVHEEKTVTDTPVINVTIGRVEVRAVPADPAPRRSNTPAERMSLDEYLRRRAERPRR